MLAFMPSPIAPTPAPPPWAIQTFLTGILMGLASLLALLTLVSGLRAQRGDRTSSRALMAAALALLTCCVAFEAFTAEWVSRAASLAVLQVALLLLALALGWAVFSRRSDFRRTTEAARSAAVAHQAHDLEILVQERNAELSARLRDLGEARRTAEVANQSLQRALDQLEQAASTDRLTGAWNRRRFEEAVLPEIALAHRRREPLSLLMFDLDHFKRVNDTFGHSTGDAVLASAAQTVRLHLRLSDSLIRWGGEEFLVMAPATRLEGAMGLAEKLRIAMAAIDFPNVGQVTMSLGVSEYALEESLETWIERTDQALYRAKAEGRNRVVSALPPERPGPKPSAERSMLEMLWEDTYASGHALIDAQHHRLFQLASALMSVLTENRPVAEVSLRLETLLAHTAQHFHDEETLLRKASYADLSEHAATHAALLKKALSLQSDVQAGRLDFGKLVSFLALDLVKGHILSEDRDYFAHLRTCTEPDGAPPAGA
jgi:diguanylate cyclase